jgi:hypothetical protein
VSQEHDSRIPAALRSGPARQPGADPLKFCVFTTLALLAWVAGPFVVTLMAALGLIAYGRAVTRGQRSTRCWLRDTRLAVVYLSVALVAGLIGLVHAVR